MVRTVQTRMNEVRAVVEAARRVVEHRAASQSNIKAAIVESTGLSAAGVELALTKHLEIDPDPTDDDLRKLVERAGSGDAPVVVVVLSSNVFVGALRAIAIARATSSNVIVRPSRRDPAFARALVEALNVPTSVRIDDDVDVATIEDGEIHVYGRSETIAELRARARPGVRFRGHGSALGVAWISLGASSSASSIEASARGLADDVIAFDQRGCLSPRLALVEGTDEQANAFAEALHAELERLDVAVPRGPIPAEERAASDRYVATMTYACRALVGTQHAIGIAPAGAPIVLAPAYRHVHLAACATLPDARALLLAAEPLSQSIIAVGSDDLDQARSLAPPWARVSALGSMQRPRLDGPVDLREIALEK